MPDNASHRLAGRNITRADVPDWVIDLLARMTAEPTAACVEEGGRRMVAYPGGSTNLARMIVAARDGDVPAGLVVRHTCDNPACANPSHLVVGTHADNVADMMARGRHRPPRSWMMGHLRDRPNHPKRRAVVDGNGKEWPSAALAADALGLTRQGVAYRCSNNVNGWRWAGGGRAS